MYYEVLWYIGVYLGILRYIGVYWGILMKLAYIRVYWGILGILGSWSYTIINKNIILMEIKIEMFELSLKM